MKKLILFLSIAFLYNTWTFAQSEVNIARRDAADAEFAKLEGVKDLSNLANSPNLISEAKKLMNGNTLIVENFRFRPPVLKMNDGSLQVTIESIEFGDKGRTVLFTLDIPSQNVHGTLSFSGKNAGIVPSEEDGTLGFVLVKGLESAGTVVKVEEGWGGMPQKVSGMVSDFYRGQTKAEVEAICGKLGLSQFKESGTTANYKIYSLYWIDMKKKYDLLGDYSYEMTNDKRYGDFYFDKKGQLMKWFLYM